MSSNKTKAMNTKTNRQNNYTNFALKNAVKLSRGLVATLTGEKKMGKILPPLQKEYTCTMAMFNGFPKEIFFKRIVLGKPKTFAQRIECTIISNEGKLLTWIEFDPIKKAKMLEIMKERELTLWQWEEIKAELKAQGLLPKPEEYI